MYIAVKFEGKISPRHADIVPTTFRSLSLQERHLEEFIRLNINLLFEDDETLLVVGQQVHNARRGISDLIAVDSDGNVVLIEIKRDLDDIVSRAEPFEFQAIRYAASFAKIETPEQVVDLVYSKYIEQHKDEYDLGQLTAAEKARRELNQFLISNEALKTFNKKQRIILIASAFDDQTLSAVAWLIANHVDISCLGVTPVFIGPDGFLEIEKVLPPVRLDEFYVELAASSRDLSGPSSGRNPAVKTPRQLLPRMAQLFDWGVVAPGTVLRIKNFAGSEAEAIDSKHVRYNYAKTTYYEWGKQVTGWSAINIYEWAIRDDTGKTLDELRREKMAELEEEALQSGENDALEDAVSSLA